MTYEELLDTADAIGLVTREKDLRANAGRIKGRRIAIRRDMSYTEKACVLAEELGHYFTTAGDITDQTNAGSRKQERRAREWAHDVQIGLDGIIAASDAGCRNLYEAADYLDVPEDFLREAIACYRERYGSKIRYRGCDIIFTQGLEVIHGEEKDSKIYE